MSSLRSELAAFNAAFDELSDTVDGWGQPAHGVDGAAWRTRYQAAASDFAAAIDRLIAEDAPDEAGETKAALHKVRKESRRLLRAIHAAVDGQPAYLASAAEHSQRLKLAMADVEAALSSP